MDGENAKVKDKVELSLDGRQIASVVVGALVLLGVVFVLGLNVGRQLAVKQLEATRGDALAVLDQPPPAPAVREESLTFHDKLTKEKAGEDPAPPVTPAPSATAPAPHPAPPPAAQSQAASPAAEEGARPEPPKGAFVIQLVATPSKAEADKLVAKLKEFQPRIEAAEVAGKGRMYRVRVGAYATKPEAEKALKAIAGKAGTKGMVVAAK